MKKTIIVTLCICLAMFGLVACAQPNRNTTFPTPTVNVTPQYSDAPNMPQNTAEPYTGFDNGYVSPAPAYTVNPATTPNTSIPPRATVMPQLVP